jgi:rod shape-determining protein MreD
MGEPQRQRFEERLFKGLLLIAALFMVAAFQTALLPRVGGAQLNLVLLLVICQGLITGGDTAARWAFYGGLAIDVCAPGLPLGSHALALLAGALVGLAPFRRLSRNNWGIPLAGVLLGALTYHGVIGALTALLVGPMPYESFARETMLPGLIVALVPTLPLYLLLRWIDLRRRGEVRIEIY